jgi:mevalonate kinase
MKISVSVPGKIYLMGEHAVVYGKPALLSAINLRLSVSVEPASKLDIISTEPTDHVRYAVEYVAKAYALQKLPNVKITITSDIPAGYHLGSSAAVAVAVVGALMYHLKEIWNLQILNQCAYEIEKKQHGNPSGADNTIVTMGGFLWYRKELEFLRSFWQLPFTFPSILNHFCLIDTGRPKENTGEMVTYVREEYQKHTVRYKKLFDENEDQTKRIAVALKEGDEKTLITSVRKGQWTLEKMGVVSNKVTRVIRKIEHAGGAAKILGGGGRTDGAGYLLCYSHRQITSSIPIMLGEQGIRLEKNI